ncbi:Elongation of very long chain fatty acids protein 7 [Nymphon striatum]|nr:Elongation of very long chain fatty acids protein 7 [Nymphon striatum]
MEAINATLTLALDLYQSIVDSGDPRTQHFVGVHSPCPTVLITLIYLFLVFQLIPWYMKDKEPFDLRTPMFIYNAVVAGISASHFYLVSFHLFAGQNSAFIHKGLSGKCGHTLSAIPLVHYYTLFVLHCLIIYGELSHGNKPMKSQNEDQVDNMPLQLRRKGFTPTREIGALISCDFLCCFIFKAISPSFLLQMVNLSWLYWVMKIVELLDTIFFALRKKRSQITFLHVYHHTIMILCSWYVIKFSAVGHASFVGFTNSLVHAVMYAYYGLASMGPHMKKYLWWKRYLTKMQLIQLVLNIIQGCQLFILECNYPRWIVGHAVINSTIFLYLFIKFYIQEYKRNSQRNIKKKT